MTKRFFFPPVDMKQPSIPELLLSDMVAFYAFDNAAGLDAPDSHGNGPDLPDVGGVNRVAGVHDTAMGSDIAVGEYYLLPSASGDTFKFTGSFTISFFIWVSSRPSKGGGACYHTIWYRGAALQGGYSLLSTAIGDEIDFSVAHAGGSKIIHGSCDVGKWVFYTAIHRAATKTLELWNDNSGSLTKETTDTYTTYDPSSRDTTIGGPLSSPTSGRMYLDDLVFFDTDLSQEQIEWIYNSGSGRSYVDYG